MGAGDGSGPQRYGQAEDHLEERRQRELRHEHAAHEQRVRHRDVAERGIALASRIVIV